MKELVYPRLLLPVVERLADKVAFVDLTRDGVRYEGTFAVHADRLLRLANAMHSELGLGHGDRFAVLATNGHEFLELYHAALFGVGIINPLNSASRRPSWPMSSMTPVPGSSSPTRCSPSSSAAPVTRKACRSTSWSSSAGRSATASQETTTPSASSSCLRPVSRSCRRSPRRRMPSS